MYRRYFSTVLAPFVRKSCGHFTSRVSSSSVLGEHFCPPRIQTWISPKNLDFWVKYFPPQIFTQSKFFRGSTADSGPTHDEDHEYPISFVRTPSYHVFFAIRWWCRKCKFRVSAFSPLMLVQGSNLAHAIYILYTYHMHSIYTTRKHSTQSINLAFRTWSTPNPFREKSWCGIHPLCGTYPVGRVSWTGPEATFPPLARTSPQTALHHACYSKSDTSILEQTKLFALQHNNQLQHRLTLSRS